MGVGVFVGVGSGVLVEVGLLSRVKVEDGMGDGATVAAVSRLLQLTRNVLKTNTNNFRKNGTFIFCLYHHSVLKVSAIAPVRFFHPGAGCPLCAARP